MSKIETETKLLKVAATVKGGQVEFGVSKFNQEQNQTIARWIQDKEKMEINIGGIPCRALITKATVDGGGEVLGFKAFEFKPEQFGKLVVIIAKNEPVEVIYEPVQKDLPGLKGPAKGQESLDFDDADPNKKKLTGPQRSPLQLQKEKEDTAAAFAEAKKKKKKAKVKKKPVKRGMVRS